MRYPRARNFEGFSLPEILIVILTIAILAVLAVPQLTPTLQLNRIQTGSSIVSSKLAEAKMMAVKQNKSVSFVLDENNRQVWIESNSTVIGSVQTLPQEIKIRITPDTTATKEFVTFNSMGMLVTTPAAISVYYEAKRLAIPVSISISGKIMLGEMGTY